MNVGRGSFGAGQPCARLRLCRGESRQLGRVPAPAPGPCWRVSSQMRFCKPCVYIPSSRRAAVGFICVYVSPRKGNLKSELQDFVCCIPSAVCQGLCRRWDKCCLASEPVQGRERCWRPLQLLCEDIKPQEKAEMQCQRSSHPASVQMPRGQRIRTESRWANRGFSKTQPLGEVWVLLACKLRSLAQSRSSTEGGF